MTLDFYFFVFCITAILAVIIAIPIAEYSFKGRITAFKISLLIISCIFLAMFITYSYSSAENYRFRKTAIHVYASVIDFSTKSTIFGSEKMFIKAQFLDKSRNTFITSVEVDSFTWNLYSLEPTRKFEIYYLPNQQQKAMISRYKDDATSYFLSALCFFILCASRFISSKYYGKLLFALSNKDYASYIAFDSTTKR